MNKRTDEELCKWLRDNSSGCYRPSTIAADRIEELNRRLSEVEIILTSMQITRDFSPAVDKVISDLIGFMNTGNETDLLNKARYTEV